MAAQTTPEQPMPVCVVALKIQEWVNRLGRIWVEGQVAQIGGRGATAFLTLRDPVADVSLSVTCPRAVAEGIAEGERVVVHAKPGFYLTRGTLSLQALEIRAVGVGELLARIERLK